MRAHVHTHTHTNTCTCPHTHTHTHTHTHLYYIVGVKCSDKPGRHTQGQERDSGAHTMSLCQNDKWLDAATQEAGKCKEEFTQKSNRQQLINIVRGKETWI